MFRVTGTKGVTRPYSWGGRKTGKAFNVLN